MKRLIFMLAMFMAMMVANAQQIPPKKGISKANKYPTLPSGYSQVGTTRLYSKQTADAIDVIGFYDGYYYSSTYNDVGYKVAVKVGNSTAARVNCLTGTTNNGVNVQSSVEQQGELARIYYTVTNTNNNDVVVSLGTYADVMIGTNDKAPISRRIDTEGQTYGLTMKDGNGAQLCVLFGSGLAGVTAVSEFWFGFYTQNSETSKMVGNYSSGSYYMVENGSYDSGMGWCWKQRTLPAGSTTVFSYLIGVGEVNLEPNSSFEATPDDPEGWNDLSRPHRITLEGTYESPAGLDGVIDYAVEENEEWTALTEVLASGDTFTASLVAMFNPNCPVHTIHLRTRDLVGNTTTLPSIEYRDVSFCPIGGIVDKTYTGDSIFQDALTCELEAEEYVVGNYDNNVSVGEASFTVEGVFPTTIGRKTYTFNILPQPLSGQLELEETEFVYNGQSFAPAWHFSNESYSNLKVNQDYTFAWANNVLPGTGTLTVTGKNNYTGTLTANIHIDKAPLVAGLYSFTLPAEVIIYDQQAHGAAVSVSNGVGNPTISYLNKENNDETTEAPTLPGSYEIYLSIADGVLYKGMDKTLIGTVSIQLYNTEQYALLSEIASNSQTYHMYFGTRTKLTQFIRSTSSALQGGDLSTIYQAFLPMESLLEEVQVSVEKYNLLASYITYAQKVQNAYGSMLTDEINAKITDTITKLQAAYNFGLLTNEDVDQVWPQLQETMRTELANVVMPYIEKADSVIAQGLIEDIYYRLVQTSQEVQALLTWTEFSIDDANYIKTLLANVRDLGEEAQNNVQDLAFLREAYIAMGGAEKLAGYWQFETSPYRLNGVTFTAGQVTSINLAGRNLTGSIPVSFYLLPKLNTLNLSRNQLTGNIGVEMAAFQNEKPTTIAIQELNIANNKLSGNVGLFANYFANLTMLNASGNCLEDVYPMIPATVTSLNISNQTITRVVPLHLANLSTDDIATKVPSILLYDHQNQTFKTNINLLCQTPDESWNMTMSYQDGQLSATSTSGKNTYYGESGDTLNVALLYNNGVREGSTFRIKLSFDEGDGNFDGQVNVLDLQTDILYIMENYPTRPYNFTAANLWKDELINVQDVIRLVDQLMSIEPVEPVASARRKAQGLEAICDASVYVKDGQLMLNTSEPVAALDILLTGASRISIAYDLERTGMFVITKKASDGLHIIAYSMNGSCIPFGSSAIGTLDSNAATVRSAMLSDSEANAISVSLEDETTGIEELPGMAESDGQATYDLQGRRVNAISHKGIYIKNGRKMAK